jgi:hypothetical protein
MTRFLPGAQISVVAVTRDHENIEQAALSTRGTVTPLCSFFACVFNFVSLAAEWQAKFDEAQDRVTTLTRVNQGLMENFSEEKARMLAEREGNAKLSKRDTE